MKKIAVITVVAALAGCASDTETMQLVASSSEEVYTAAQLRTMEQMQEAKTKQAVIASKEEAVAPALTPVPVVKEVTKTASAQVKPPKPEAKPVVTAKPKAEAKKPVYKYGKAATEGYTIQVLALSHNKGFTPYMNKLPSDQPVWMNKKEVQGLPWYTLLFGHYDTREEAKRALNALPKDVRDYGPFIRSLDEIKASPTPKLTKLN